MTTITREHYQAIITILNLEDEFDIYSVEMVQNGSNPYLIVRTSSNPMHFGHRIDVKQIEQLDADLTYLNRNSKAQLDVTYTIDSSHRLGNLYCYQLSTLTGQTVRHCLRRASTIWQPGMLVRLTAHGEFEPA